MTENDPALPDTPNSLLDNNVSAYSPLMMHVIDEQGTITEVNGRWLERMGFSLDQVVGRKIYEFFSPASREVARRDLANVGPGDVYLRIPREFVTAQGEIIETEIDARIVRFDANRIVRYIGVIIDVTARNQRERELRAREEELRTLVEFSPDGIMIHTDGKYVYANSKACEMLGARDASELVGREALDFVHPSIREEVRKRIRGIHETKGQSAPRETLFIRLDGEAVPVESNGASIIYQGKRSVQVVIRDIRERKRAEAIARENEVQNEVIRTQQEMLLAVSTPLLPLREHVVLMPLVGRMDNERGERATETLLQGIGEHAARIAILDVTGVPEIGPDMAEGLRRAIHAGQLLGAEVVVTGIQPAIARTMIELGLDMTGIMTRATLRDGIAYAFKRVR